MEQVSVGSSLNPSRIASSKTLRSKVPANRSMEGFGKHLAEDYLKAMGGAAGTWLKGILNLLKTANDKQQEQAMHAASKVAEGYADETAGQSLKKRISEARRVFKASHDAYKATLEIMDGAGTWHEKIAKLPKATNKGRPKGQGAGKTTAPAEGKALDKNERERISKQDLGAIVDAIKKLSFDDARTVLDVVLFHLSVSPNEKIKSAASASMRIWDAVDGIKAPAKSDAGKVNALQEAKAKQA